MSTIELSYLRNELNQRLNFFYEHSNKVISRIWLTWSGALVLFGMTQNFSEINTNNIVVSFLALVMVFISNLLVYFAAQKDYENIGQVFEIAAYITIFYEKKVNNDWSNNDNSWEIASLESLAARDTSINKPMNGEYTVIAIASTFMILILLCYITSMIFCTKSVMHYVIVVLGVVILGTSIALIPMTFRRTSLKYIKVEKVERLRFFLDYAIDNGYFSESDIVKQFGSNFLKIINYSQKQKN